MSRSLITSLQAPAAAAAAAPAAAAAHSFVLPPPLIFSSWPADRRIALVAALKRHLGESFEQPYRINNKQ